MHSFVIATIVAVMTAKATLHIFDTSSRNRASTARLGYSLGYHCEVYGSLSEFSIHPPRKGVLIASDSASEGGVMDVFDLFDRIGVWLPLIATAERPSPARIVAVIKSGAMDYLALPLERDRLGRSLETIVREAQQCERERRRTVEARSRIWTLSNREREVLECLAKGSSNKVIARALDISPRTVEIHRANMMSKLGASHAAEAVRLRVEAKLDEHRVD